MHPDDEMRTTMRIGSTAIALLVLIGAPAASPLAAAELPNIVFIMGDDQGWSDIGYHGSDVMTPHLDRLAAEGTKLEQYYVYPTCSPTRVALLTGRNPARYGVLAPLAATSDVPSDAALLPRGLQRLGYTTHISGKWHIGETEEHRPLKHGFTTSYGYLRGQIDPYTHRYKTGDHITWHRNDQFIEEDGHVTDLISREAVRVIESAGDKPFFLYVAHHAPHYPLNEPPQWIAPYETTIDNVWRRHYAAAITHLDHHVGRIIDALARCGLRERTLIIYTSDNGGQRNWEASRNEYNGRYASHTTLGDNRPLRGWKGDLYEGGIRVPALVNWPGKIPAGHVVSSPTHVLDWAATLLPLAAGDTDAAFESQPVEGHPLEGEDIWPLLSGQRERDQRERIGERRFWWRTPHQSAARQGDWKLVHGRGRDQAELFNVANDPNEQNDLADQHPEKVAQLKELIEP